jgi:ribosomal protein S1
MPRKNTGFLPEGFVPQVANEAASERWQELGSAKKRGVPVYGIISSYAEDVGYTVDLGADIMGILRVEDFGPTVDKFLDPGKNQNKIVGSPAAVIVTDIDTQHDEPFCRVSRKAALEIMAKKVTPTLTVGADVPAVVVVIAPSFALVDLGGVTGRIMRGEVSHSYVDSVKDILTLGQSVVVRVLSVPTDDSPYDVSRKAVLPDPWIGIDKHVIVGSTRYGKVRGMNEYGVFVEVKPGVDALCRNPRIPVSLGIGQGVTFRITKVNAEAKRISGRITHVRPMQA